MRLLQCGYRGFALAISLALAAPAVRAAPYLLVTGDYRSGGEVVGTHCYGGWLQYLTAAAEDRLRKNDPQGMVDAHALPGELAPTLEAALAQAKSASAQLVLWAQARSDPAAPHEEQLCKSFPIQCGFSSDVWLADARSKAVLIHVHGAGNGEEICRQLGMAGAVARPLYDLLQREHKKVVDAAVAQAQQQQRDQQAALEAKRKEAEENELKFVKYKPGQRLAVLEFESALADKNRFDRLALSDQVRSIPATRAPGLLVMTRENEEQILQANGKALAECVGECETDTGRKLGADYVVSGRLYQSGTNVRAMLKLFRTVDGALLSTASATGNDQDSMENGIEQAAGKLFAVLKRQ